MKPISKILKFWLLPPVFYTGFIIVSVLWSAILFPVVKLLKRLGLPLFDFIFLVYPGTASQVRAYAPLWYRNIKPTPSVIGIIRESKKGGRGLVMAMPWAIEEVESNGDFLQKIVKETGNLAELIGAKAVALGGRVVTVLHKQGFELKLPLLPGDKGAVYVILSSIKQGLKEANIEHQDIKVGILGYGFLGSHIGYFLKKYWGWNVIGIDPRFDEPKDQDGIRLTPDFSEIRDCNLILVLTPRGSDIADEIKYFRPGTLVVDDTHPPLSKKLISIIQEKGCKVLKATLELQGTSFFPKLPGWEKSWIPGCCIEAIVVSRFGDISGKSQEEFNALADQAGFTAIKEIQ